MQLPSSIKLLPKERLIKYKRKDNLKDKTHVKIKPPNKKAKKYGLGNIFAANMTDRGLISLLNKELIRISAKT